MIMIVMIKSIIIIIIIIIIINSFYRAPYPVYSRLKALYNLQVTHKKQNSLSFSRTSLYHDTHNIQIF